MPRRLVAVGDRRVDQEPRCLVLAHRAVGTPALAALGDFMLHLAHGLDCWSGPTVAPAMTGPADQVAGQVPGQHPAELLLDLFEDPSPAEQPGRTGL